MAIYPPVVCKDEQQLAPASSLSGISSLRVNTTHCVGCRIKSDRLGPCQTTVSSPVGSSDVSVLLFNYSIIKLQWVRFHLDALVAVEDSNWTKQGPFLCCKGRGSCEEHGCPVHFCITSLPSWQGFQHTAVGTLGESEEESEVSLPT